MAYKRLRSGKHINSGEMADFSLAAKEQIFEAIRNQFVETSVYSAGSFIVSTN